MHTQHTPYMHTKFFVFLFHLDGDNSGIIRSIREISKQHAYLWEDLLFIYRGGIFTGWQDFYVTIYGGLTDIGVIFSV